MTGKEMTSLALLGLAAVYDISPVDIIPDIPVVGWVDDFVITATTALNCVQQFTAETSQTLSTLAKTLKWILILVGGILIVLIVLLAGFILSKF